MVTSRRPCCSHKVSASNDDTIEFWATDPSTFFEQMPLRLGYEKNAGRDDAPGGAPRRWRKREADAGEGEGAKKKRAAQKRSTFAVKWNIPWVAVWTREGNVVCWVQCFTGILHRACFARKLSRSTFISKSLLFQHKWDLPVPNFWTSRSK